MKFLSQAALLLASAAAAIANTVTFIPEDDLSRTIIFTPSAGHAEVESITVAGDSQEVSFPQGWIGNWYAVIDGEEDVPGMLGEVTFQGWNDLTYYDVSAIVNPDDVNNVHWMYPVGHENKALADGSDDNLWSGCDSFPCLTCYNLPDDVQTKTTPLTDLVCTLGQNGA